ncbi:unnamed protein product [Effrenium voratum]|nr:unnamed protein product [Effrenium voratum]
MATVPKLLAEETSERSNCSGTGSTRGGQLCVQLRLATIFLLERPRCPRQLQGIRNTAPCESAAQDVRCPSARVHLLLRSGFDLFDTKPPIDPLHCCIRSCSPGALCGHVRQRSDGHDPGGLGLCRYHHLHVGQDGLCPGLNARLVVFFYLVEICSWWPFLSQIAIEADVLLMVRYLSTELIVMTFLVVCGFYAIPGSSKFRGSILNIVLHFFGQVALAATMSPFLAGANLLFFDNSLTFRYLNRWYYPVRYLHVALYVERLPYSIHQLFLDPVNDIAVVFLSIQIILVYLVVPKLRTASQRDKAEEFQQKTGGALEVSVTNVKGMHGDQSRPRATTGLRSRIFHDAPRATEGEDSFVEVLNAVGDTFEALLLASQADSPRVRCAVLGVAIQPLSEAGTAKLLLLLPLILPQLLLALRWTTVEDFEETVL